MTERVECSQPLNDREENFEDNTSLSLGSSSSEEDDNEVSGNPTADPSYTVDSVEDFRHIMFEELTEHEVRRVDFKDTEIAYDFFNEYGKARGFSIRKFKVRRSKADATLGDILEKSFVCSRQGVRHSKHLENPDRQREPRCITRCGCKAEFRVHIDAQIGRWKVSLFNDLHNHELLADRYAGRLRSHCKMTDADMAEMNSMRRVGISTPLIYAAFAQQSGGYANVGFNKKKLYNEQTKKRKAQNGDAKAALSLLRDMASLDSKVFWRHQVDDEGRLRNLFWCDGDSCVDYFVFGDILAFDATYGRNRYKCPVVVFSGINHHKQTVVFACAVVSDETEQTYTWMLQQFLAAMNGKAPKAVITDGDRAMKNAIASVFHEAHHRLCGWHLLRNATSNVGKPTFTKGFGRCMFGDYEVEAFEEKWQEVVVENGVEDVQWVNEVYSKKKMWATAYMRGHFFAGIRTTSRCEGLHTQIGRYVGSRDSLYEFLQHFQRCLNYMRNNEVEADFKCCYGDPVLQTCLQTLEASAAKIYTFAIFKLFRCRLNQLACLNVFGSRETANCIFFTVKKYTVTNVRAQWHVCFYPNEMEWRCPCRGMESYGIPCTHILKTIVHMGIHEVPPNLICSRWKKNAKEGFELVDSLGNTTNYSNRLTRFAALQYACKRFCSVACRSIDDFNKARELVNAETAELLERTRSSQTHGSVDRVNLDAEVGDPVRVRTKGCGPFGLQASHLSKTPRRCTNCREVGHNIRRCPDSQPTQSVMHPMSGESDDDDDYDSGDDVDIGDHYDSGEDVYIGADSENESSSS